MNLAPIVLWTLDHGAHVVPHDAGRAGVRRDQGGQDLPAPASSRPCARTAAAAPIPFTLDGEDVVFSTGADTVKGRNLRHPGRVLLVVAEPTPPYDFFTLEGRVEISEDLDEMLRWARRSVRPTQCGAG